MQMISVKIVLDKRSQKKDGTYPLKLRIVHNRQTYHLALGHSFSSKDWDGFSQQVKPSCKTLSNKTRFNAQLNKQKQQAWDILLKLQDEGQLDEISFSRIKSLLTKNSAETFVLEYGEEIKREMIQAGKLGNARVYATMLASISDYLKGRDIPLRQINYNFLKKYSAWYQGRGNTINGMAVHLRTLRALLNRAIKEKRLSPDHYPFREFKIKHEKTLKRAISSDALTTIKYFNARTKRQKRAKALFMFSFYTMGASFVDVALLKLSDIHDGRIYYKRRKTGHLHSIPMSKPLQAVIDEQTKGKTAHNYIFDVVRSDDPAVQAVQIRDELRRYNRTLKEIGELCGLNTPLTSYVSRHTYATIAKRKGVPTAVISEALGHSSEEVTQVYLDSFEQETMDEFHKMVIES
jgi:integrase